MRLFTFLFLLSMIFSCKGQLINKISKEVEIESTNDSLSTYVPKNITRNIRQDKKGNIWIAAFDGAFRYDGKTFKNITEKISSDRFFSLLEDNKGNMWLGSIGSGVYLYNGKTIKNFNTKDGLINNEVLSICEDKIGNIWIGVNGGVSCYDGKSFRNFILANDTLIEDHTGITIPNLQRPVHEVNTILEDKSGKIWLGTRDHSFVYDGKQFTTLKYNDKPFTNVRCIIEDNKGNILLGGSDGLWMYDGNNYTNITKDFVGYIYQDKSGNIWTSSESTVDRKWVLSRFDARSLYKADRFVTEFKAEYIVNEAMLFGITEDNVGNIWFGGLKGLYRYDGRTFEGFDGK